jgi:hypothetical protein
MAKASPFALSIDNNGGVLVEAGDGWTFRTAPDLLIGLRTALPEPGSLPVRLWILVIIARNGPAFGCSDMIGSPGAVPSTSESVLIRQRMLAGRCPRF